MNQVLRDELQQDPEQLGYAPLIAAGNMAGLAALLNETDPLRLMSRETFVTGRGVLADLGVSGAVILEKLSQFGATPQQDPQAEGLRLAVKWAMKFAEQEGEGIDIGHPNTRALMQTAAAVGVLTEGEATLLLNLAVLPVSRAVELLGCDVSVNEVTEAVNGG